MTKTIPEVFEAANDWFMANRAYLIEQVSYLKYLLRTSYPEFSSERTSEKTRNYLENISQLRDKIPGTVPLEYLCDLFSLSLFEKNILLLAIAGELDSSFLNPLEDGNSISVNNQLIEEGHAYIYEGGKKKVFKG